MILLLLLLPACLASYAAYTDTPIMKRTFETPQPRKETSYYLMPVPNPNQKNTRPNQCNALQPALFHFTLFSTATHPVLHTASRSVADMGRISHLVIRGVCPPAVTPRHAHSHARLPGHTGQCAATGSLGDSSYKYPSYQAHQFNPLVGTMLMSASLPFCPLSQPVTVLA